MELKQIAIDHILPDPKNPGRYIDPKRLDELTASILGQGVRVPLIGFVVPEGAMLVDGHLRLLAAKAARLATLPVIVFSKRPDEAEILAAQLTIDAHRRSFNPIELLDSYTRLASLKRMSASQIAEELGIKASKVSNILGLARLSSQEKELVGKGLIAESAAFALARMPAEKRGPYVEKALAGEMTRDELNARARRPRKREESKARRVNCRLKGRSVSVRAATGLSLTDLIDLLDELIRACRKLRSEGLDLGTAIRVLEQRSHSQPA